VRQEGLRGTAGRGSAKKSVEGGGAVKCWAGEVLDRLLALTANLRACTRGLGRH
jgi:hypothetical protein